MLNADAAYSSNRYFSIFPLFSSVAGNGSSVGAVGDGALSGQLHGLWEDGACGCWLGWSGVGCGRSMFDHFDDLPVL